MRICQACFWKSLTTDNGGLKKVRLEGLFGEQPTTTWRKELVEKREFQKPTSRFSLIKHLLTIYQTCYHKRLHCFIVWLSEKHSANNRLEKEKFRNPTSMFSLLIKKPDFFVNLPNTWRGFQILRTSRRSWITNVNIFCLTFKIC